MTQITGGITNLYKFILIKNNLKVDLSVHGATMKEFEASVLNI